jgi:hypothetical protein
VPDPGAGGRDQGVGHQVLAPPAEPVTPAGDAGGGERAERPAIGGDLEGDRCRNLAGGPVDESWVGLGVGPALGDAAAEDFRVRVLGDYPPRNPT